MAPHLLGFSILSLAILLLGNLPLLLNLYYITPNSAVPYSRSYLIPDEKQIFPLRLLLVAWQVEEFDTLAMDLLQLELLSMSFAELLEPEAISIFPLLLF